jgi:hypothetical protein
VRLQIPPDLEKQKNVAVRGGRTARETMGISLSRSFAVNPANKYGIFVLILSGTVTQNPVFSISIFCSM